MKFFYFIFKLVFQLFEKIAETGTSAIFCAYLDTNSIERFFGQFC